MFPELGKVLVQVKRASSSFEDSNNHANSTVSKEVLENLLNVSSTSANCITFERRCKKSLYTIIKCAPLTTSILSEDKCNVAKPMVCSTRNVIHTKTKSLLLLKGQFIDGDPIIIKSEEVDFLCLIRYINCVTESVIELLQYLINLSKRFRVNLWFRRNEGVWLSWIINMSKWKDSKSNIFDCYLTRDAVGFLESKEFQQVGYLPVLSAFKPKLARTSSGIVDNFEVACKLKEWKNPLDLVITLKSRFIKFF